jgi:hypothetical protein
MEKMWSSLTLENLAQAGREKNTVTHERLRR